MSLDIDRLKQIAQNATAGPWHNGAGNTDPGKGEAELAIYDSDGDYVCHAELSGWERRLYKKAPCDLMECLRFIAAANPAVVLELIEQRDELLSALTECVGRLHWINDPRTGNTEKPWIKLGETAIANAGGDYRESPDKISAAHKKALAKVGQLQVERDTLLNALIELRSVVGKSCTASEIMLAQHMMETVIRSVGGAR
jgi:hypothetical protein